VSSIPLLLTARAFRPSASPTRIDE
jgi:hypothetical protein